MSKKRSVNDKSQDKKLVIVSIILVVVVISSCFSLMFLNGVQSEINQVPGGDSEMIQYDTYQKIGSDELFGLLDNTEATYTVYVGRDTCPHCSAWSPKLIEVIQEKNVFVYYYDTAAARADNTKKLNELMDTLNVSSVPALLKIKNGEVVSRLDDYESKEAIVDFINVD